MSNRDAHQIHKTMKNLKKYIFFPVASLIYFFTQGTSKREPEISIESKEAGHELSEANAKGLMWFGISIFLGAIIMHSVLTVFFFDLHRRDSKNNPLSSAREISPHLLSQRKPPSQPRLQVDPQFDLQNYFKEQKRLLSSYEWIDQRAKKVRIPIDRAIEILSRGSKD